MDACRFREVDADIELQVVMDVVSVVHVTDTRDTYHDFCSTSRVAFIRSVVVMRVPLSGQLWAYRGFEVVRLCYVTFTFMRVLSLTGLAFAIAATMDAD